MLLLCVLPFIQATFRIPIYQRKNEFYLKGDVDDFSLNLQINLQDHQTTIISPKSHKETYKTSP